MTIAKPDNADVLDEYRTDAEIVADIRQRIMYGPDIVGNDMRALPPVDWEKVLADQKAEEEWQQQFEDVKAGRFDKRD
jgi:hypothetical protein